MFDVVDKVSLRTAAFVSFMSSECGEMNEVDVRRVFGRRVVTGEIATTALCHFRTVPCKSSCGKDNCGET
jgi:hypothetical protein